MGCPFSVLVPVPDTATAATTASGPGSEADAALSTRKARHYGVPDTALCRSDLPAPRCITHNAVPGSRGERNENICPGEEGDRRRAIGVVAALPVTPARPRRWCDAGPPLADQKAGDEGNRDSGTKNPRREAGVGVLRWTGGSGATATAIRPTNCYMMAKNGDRSPDRIAAPLAATVGNAR